MERMTGYHNGKISSGTIAISEPSVIVDSSYLAEIEKQSPKVEISNAYQRELSSSWDKIDNDWDDVFADVQTAQQNKAAEYKAAQDQIDQGWEDALQEATAAYNQRTVSGVVNVAEDKIKIDPDYQRELAAALPSVMVEEQPEITIEAELPPTAYKMAA